MQKAKSTDKVSLRDGNLVEWEGFEDSLYITAYNESRPRLIDRSKHDVTEEDGVIYSGCYVNVVVDVYGMDDPVGVFCSLGGVQFNRDGEAFSGGSIASLDDFEDLGVDESDNGEGLF